MIFEIIIVYLSIYVGLFLGKLSNDELEYKKYFWVNKFLILMLSITLITFNYYVGPLMIALSLIVFKKEYSHNLMQVFVGISCVLSNNFLYTVSFASIYELTYGAIMYSKKENVFKNSIGFFIGIIIGFIIKIL